MKKTLLIAGMCGLLVSCDKPADDTNPPEPVPSNAGASSTASSLIKTKVYRHNGKDFALASIDKNPEFYILYISASW